MNHVVFADPENNDARNLQADAMEQMGYQAESSTWRNAYLMGAQELRNGSPRHAAAGGRQLVQAMTAEHMFDTMGVRFNPEAFGRDTAAINWHFTDLDESHVLGIARSAIHHDALATRDEADASITTTREALALVLGGIVSFDDAIATPDFVVDGDVDAVRAFLACLENFQTAALIEP